MEINSSSAGRKVSSLLLSRSMLNYNLMTKLLHDLQEKRTLEGLISAQCPDFPICSLEEANLGRY